MYAMEKELVIPYTKNKKSYNRTEGGKGGFSHISKEDRQRNTKKSWGNSEIRNSRTEKIKQKRKSQIMGTSPLKGKTFEDIHGDNADAIRNKISESTKLTSNTLTAIERSKTKMLAMWEDVEFKENRSEAIKNGWDKGRDSRVGLNHVKADKTIYEFIHDSGLIEKCTRVEMKEKHKIGNISKLISGTIKSSMGWKVKR